MRRDSDRRLVLFGRWTARSSGPQGPPKPPRSDGDSAAGTAAPHSLAWTPDERRCWDADCREGFRVGQPSGLPSTAPAPEVFGVEGGPGAHCHIPAGGPLDASGTEAVVGVAVEEQRQSPVEQIPLLASALGLEGASGPWPPRHRLDDAVTRSIPSHPVAPVRDSHPGVRRAVFLKHWASMAEEIPRTPPRFNSFPSLPQESLRA